MYKNHHPAAACCILLIEILFIVLNSAPKEINASSVLPKPTWNTYGEHCNRTVRCLTQSWLSCDRYLEICQCAKPDEMIYNPAKGMCTVRVGEKCKYGFDEEDEVPAALWYQKPECVEGAVCENTTGLCACPKGFYEDTETKSCSPLKSFEETCISAIECNKERLLTCMDGKCYCDPGLAIYNTVSYKASVYKYEALVLPNVCVAKVGIFCTGAFYRYTNIRDEIMCVKNAYCNNHENRANPTCRCEKNYSETTDGLCGIKYDGLCSKDSDICSDKLRCVAEQSSHYQDSNILKCKCKNPSHQEYDEEEKICRSLIGISCNPNDTRSCVHHGVCIEKDNIFRCECSDGYVENVDSKCNIAYGFPCDYNSDNFVRGNVEECDRLANLKCIHNECRCDNVNDIYEANRRQCSRPVGLTCSKTHQCVPNAFCCTQLGICIDNDNSSQCKCPDGHIQTFNNKCEIALGFPCDYENPSKEHCDTSANLKCVNNKCSCENEEEIYEQGKCRRPVGLRCKESFDCVSNAYCLKIHPMLKGRCSCQEGDLVTENHSCEIAISS